MLQQDQPDDYVLATGVPMTVRAFSQAAFERAGLDWEKHVGHDPRYERPSEVDALIGDAAKASATFGWAPQVHGVDLVNLMVDADVAALDDQLSGRAIRIDR
jgi:GDPmannose 4,6-dehydratase